MELDTLFKIILQLVRSKNPNELIKYSFLIVGFFYFIEGWDLTNIIIIVVVLLALLFILKSELVLPANVSSSVNKILDNIIPENTEQELKDNIPDIIPNLKDNIKNISIYLLELKKNNNDPAFIKILSSIIIKLKNYIEEIKKLIMAIENNEVNLYPNLSYQKIKDLENLLLEEIKSIYFKIDKNADEEINKLVDNIQNSINEMTQRIEAFIEKDYDVNINANKGPIYKSDEPQPFEK